jgi:membrane-associated protein
MDFQEIIVWLTNNQEYAELSIFLVGFFESFILIGTFWPSIVLLLVALALNEIGISIFNICFFAGIGSFLGDSLSYYLGVFFGPKMKELNFVKKREHSLSKAEKFIQNYGWGAIFIGRFLPAIRPFIPFITGISAMSQKVFVVSASIACVLWAFSLALILIGIDNIFLFLS